MSQREDELVLAMDAAEEIFRAAMKARKQPEWDNARTAWLDTVEAYYNNRAFESIVEAVLS